MSDQTAAEAVKKVTAAEIDFSTAVNFKCKEQIPAGNVHDLKEGQQLVPEGDTAPVTAAEGDKVIINALGELRYFSKTDWETRFEVDGSDKNYFRRREGGRLKWVEEPTIFVADNGKETLVAPGGGFFFSFADHKVTPFQPHEVKQWFARLFKDNTEIDLTESTVKQAAAAAQANDTAHIKDISDVTGITDAIAAAKDFTQRGFSGLRKGLSHIGQGAADLVSSAPEANERLKESRRQAGDLIRKSASNVGDEIRKNAAQAGEDIRQGVTELSEKARRWWRGRGGPGPGSGPTAPA